MGDRGVGRERDGCYLLVEVVVVGVVVAVDALLVVVTPVVVVAATRKPKGMKRFSHVPIVVSMGV